MDSSIRLRFSHLPCYIDNDFYNCMLHVELTVSCHPRKDDSRTPASATVVVNSHTKAELSIPSLLKLPHVWLSPFFSAPLGVHCSTPMLACFPQAHSTMDWVSPACSFIYSFSKYSPSVHCVPSAVRGPENKSHFIKLINYKSSKRVHFT